MIQLISLQEAKDQVHVTSAHADADIRFKILQASAILLNYIKVPLDATIDDSPLVLPWTETEVPWDIRAAALLIFAELWLNREGSLSNPLSPSVLALLHRYRDPAMA